jgi:hypothetical protein
MTPKIIEQAKALGYVVFEGEMDLNLIGVRSSRIVPNKFNDKIYVCYMKGGVWQEHCFPITTVAGSYWLQNPSRAEGTAVVVHDRQYRSVWSIGLHRGQYEALTQTGEITVWRDGNKDKKVDYGGEEYAGYFGINAHRSNRNHQSQSVDKWSAGCQVFANPSHFSAFMSLCRAQVSAGLGDKFSYTLIHEDSLKRLEEEQRNPKPKPKRKPKTKLSKKGDKPCLDEELKSQSQSRKKSSRLSSSSSKKSTKPKQKTAKAAAKSPKQKDSK